MCEWIVGYEGEKKERMDNSTGSFMTIDSKMKKQERIRFLEEQI